MLTEKLTKTVSGLLFLYRFDISIEADLIEEVRVYGYNNLPVTEPVGSLALRAQPEIVLHWLQWSII